VRGYVTHGPAVGETRGPAVGAAHRPSVGARAAALLSLLTLGAAVVLLLVGVVLHIAAVLLTLVGLLACVTAGWYAVSRRGAVRTTALMAMVVAVAVLGAGLMLENFSLPRVLLLVAAAAASVVSARYALRETTRDRRAVRERLTHAARPRHPVLIMNQDRRRWRRQDVRGARGRRPGPPLSRLAGVERAAVRGQLGRPGGDRGGRRGAADGPAAGLRVPARRAPSPAAPPRGAALAGGEDRAPAVVLDDHGTGPRGGGAPGGLTRRRTCPVLAGR
jgi:hypothetical protein